MKILQLPWKHQINKSINFMFRWKNFIYEDIHSRDGNRVNFNNGYWPRHYFFFFFSLLIISYHMNLNDSIVLSFLSFSLTFSIYKLIETTNRWSINNESFNCKKKRGVKWPGDGMSKHMEHIKYIESIFCRITSIYEDILNLTTTATAL